MLTGLTWGVGCGFSGLDFFVFVVSFIWCSFRVDGCDCWFRVCTCLGLGFPFLCEFVALRAVGAWFASLVGFSRILLSGLLA